LKREPLVVSGLAALDPDVICLQEAVTWCLQARWLAWRLSRRTGRRYHVAQSAKRGYRGILEGLAVISAFPLDSKRRLARHWWLQTLTWTTAARGVRTGWSRRSASAAGWTEPRPPSSAAT
jgi:endonuclease/exonuclease/phosphatase family metal-dependent hydrolase